MQKYIERNTEWEVQKAFAINVMCTALSVWDKGIVEAAKLAADVTVFFGTGDQKVGSFIFFVTS